MTRVLAIDQGTSGTKAVVVDHDGTVRGLSEVPVRPAYLPGGGVEQDPGELLASVLDAGAIAIAEAGIEIDAVSLANQGETVLAWDPVTGSPLSNMLVWQDRRAEAVCDELRDRESEILARTGLPLDSYFSAPKMAWLRRHVTERGVVTTSDSWLVHRLTGAFVTDASTASRSLLTDLDTGAWDAALLDAFGLSGESLPEIVGSDDVVGETEAFGRRVPVTGLIVDQQAALAAQRCTEPGEAKCTFGTGAFLLANTGTTPRPSGVGLSASIAWRHDGDLHYCLDGQIFTAASAVQWLHRLGLVDSVAELDERAAAEADGVLCVPAFAGLGAPWQRREATATFSGITLATGKDHLVRAVVDGIACQVAELVSSVAADLGSRLGSLKVDGGLTRSRVLMQAVADLAQLPVEVYPSQHATPLGSAAFARTALASGLSLEDAIIPWTAEEVFEPAWSPERADEFLDDWRRLLATRSASPDDR